MSSQSPNNSYIKGNILRCALGIGTLWYLPCMVVFQVLLKRSDLVQSDLVQPDLRNAFSLPQHRKLLEHLEATIYIISYLFYTWTRVKYAHICMLHDYAWYQHIKGIVISYGEISIIRVILRPFWPLMPDRCYLLFLVVKWRTYWPRLWAATWTIDPQKDPPGSQAKRIPNDFSRNQSPNQGSEQKKTCTPQD